MARILLVEDDTTISLMLSAYIEREGFQIDVAHDGNRAVELFELKPDLIILDINLPGKSGFELISWFRNTSHAPILMLSARASEDDKVQCLQLGADDYIPKPFSARELLARIHRHLERALPQKNTEKTLQIGNVIIMKSRLRVEMHGVEIRLTKTEHEILVHLFEHAGEVVERTTLMREIIGYSRYLSDRTIDTHIKNLRKKFEGELNIETLRAVGYRIQSF
jgi:two-component system response regulator VicR